MDKSFRMIGIRETVRKPPANARFDRRMVELRTRPSLLARVWAWLLAPVVW